ncbi:unnamed protein product, partial [Mesorhabditis belari]|uniref:DM domain-containing protein n=1 Tax=Mesorhabditis belari TaxID=2138241 RepID=A0AAF3EIM7_9BILA
MVRNVSAEIFSKRIYYCQKCLNHEKKVARKNHKCQCPFIDCSCEKCYLVEKRRFLNAQLHELEEISYQETNVATEDQIESKNLKPTFLISACRGKGGWDLDGKCVSVKIIKLPYFL